MKNILIINENFAIGGVPSVIVELVNNLRLSDDEFNFKFILLNKKNDYKDQIIQDKDVMTYLHDSDLKGGIQKLLAIFVDAYKVYRYLAVNKPDIILLNADSFQLTLPISIAKLFFRNRFPTVGWIHACLDQVKYYPNQLIKFLHKLSFLSLRKVICVSNRAKASLQNYLGDNIFSKVKSDVIYNYVHKYPITKTKLSAHNDIKNDFKLLSVGRVSVEKRLDILIEAISIIRSRYDIKNILLTIVGDGDQLLDIKNFVKEKQLCDQVLFIGKCSLPFEKFSDHDLFISCSETESFSLVTCEALSVGMPVVVTNTGAAEVVDYGKYGLVVPINAPNELAKAIIKLATDRELYKYFQNQSQYALDRFDNETITKQWAKLFNLI